MRFLLRSILLVASSLVRLPAGAAPPLSPAPLNPSDQRPWKAKIDAALPLMGHRNWILIVDSAYPLQSSTGIETVQTNAEQADVIRAVMSALDKSTHVRPNIYMDSELSFVPEKGAPGVTAYRTQITQLFAGREVHFLPHELVIGRIAEAAKMFHVLVLKSTMILPYTSVFLQLDCKYWSADEEKALREEMSKAGTK